MQWSKWDSPAQKATVPHMTLGHQLTAMTSQLLSHYSMESCQPEMSQPQEIFAFHWLLWDGPCLQAPSMFFFLLSTVLNHISIRSESMWFACSYQYVMLISNLPRARIYPALHKNLNTALSWTDLPTAMAVVIRGVWLLLYREGTEEPRSKWMNPRCDRLSS